MTSTMSSSNTPPIDTGSATAASEGSSTEIENPRDTDVLCGRGGAALRHPGNQTYRRLVSLNKGLYITCLKTEKLKISRSIVAAIREQNGRFLERDSGGKWYDIGDKKAIEKTSQALREGQPKLRQKIVEMGGPGTGGMMDSFSSGVYPPGANGSFDAYGNASGEITGIPPQPDATASAVHRLSQQQQQLAAAAAGLQQQQDVAAVAAHRLSQQQQQLAAAAAGLQQQEAAVSHRLSQQHQQLAAAAAGLQQQQDAAVVAAHRLSQQQQQLAAAAAGLQQQQDMSAAVHRMSQQQLVDGSGGHHMPDPIQRHESGTEMPPPPARPDIHADLMQRLSLREVHGGGGTADVPTSMNGLPPKAQQLRPSIIQRGSGVGMDLGVQESTFSLMSDFSSFAGSATTVSMANESLLSMDPSIGKPRAMNRGSAGLLDPTPIGSVSEHHTVFSHGSTPSEQSTASTKPGIFNTSLDRRKYFAKMKYTRPASGRFPKPMSSSQHSLGDGMPDIHMVDSTMSLFSNVSSVGADSAKMSGAGGPGETGMAAVAMAAAAAQQQQQQQLQQQMQQQQQQQQMPYFKPPTFTAGGMEYKGGSMKSIPSEFGGILDSRRSLMSGLSRISDASEVNSLFSDLSKKIGNVSTRSMAMSEISGIDAQLRDEEEDEEESISADTTGPLMTANSLDHTVTSHLQQQFDDPRRTPTTPMSANNMDFDL